MHRSSVRALSALAGLWLSTLACNDTDDTQLGDDDLDPKSPSSSGRPGDEVPSASSGGSLSSSGAGSPSTSSGGAPSSSGGAAPGGSSSGGGVPTDPLEPGSHVWTVPAAGQSRSVRVYVPSLAATERLPVVIALHGNGDSAANFEATSGLRGRADALGFVLLIPDGIARNVQVGGSTVSNVPWDAYNLEANNWDLQLFDALLDRLTTGDAVQGDKISLYGFSQGGYMAFRAARAQADRFACSAVLAAADPGGFPVSFARAIPVALQIGTNDYAYSQAVSTRQALEASSHPHQFEAINGLGHSLAPAPTRFSPLDYCLSQSL